MAAARVALFALALFAAFAGAAAAEVLVRGESRTSADEIRRIAGLTDETTAEEAEEARWRLLWQLTLNDAEIVRDAEGRWVITVDEPPLIGELRFEGVTIFGEDEIREILLSTPGEPLAPGWREYDPARLRALYKREGWLDAAVAMRTEPAEGGAVDVVFTVEEGEMIGVKSVRFAGASDDVCVLKRVVTTRENGAPPLPPANAAPHVEGVVSLAYWLAPRLGFDLSVLRSPFDPDALELDAALLRRHYARTGRPDARVLSAEATREGVDVDVVFEIAEGRTYSFGAVAVTDGSEAAAGWAERLRPLADMAEGERYDSSRIEAAIKAMETALDGAGVAFVGIEPRLAANEQTGAVGIEFRIVDRPKIRIASIALTGLEKTQEAAIRRRLPFREGDPFNPRRVREGRANLQLWRALEAVEIVTLPGEADDEVGILIHATEGLSGEFAANLGYSTRTGWGADAQYGDVNFLGRGVETNVSARISTIGAEVTASVADPWFGGERREAKWGLSFTTGDPSDPLTPLLGFQMIVWAGFVTLRIPALLVILLGGAYYCWLWREDASRVRRRARRMGRRIRALVILQSAVVVMALITVLAPYVLAPLSTEAAKLGCPVDEAQGRSISSNQMSALSMAKYASARPMTHSIRIAGPPVRSAPHT